MPNRRLPSQIAAYLGPCEESETIVEEIVEQCSLAKLTDDGGLTDYDPLVVIMSVVEEKVRGMGFALTTQEGRKAWCDVLTELQDNSGMLEHNTSIPCRSCDQAFEPVVDDTLLTLFLAWHNLRRVKDLLAIHRCPSCGGKISAKRIKKYEGDMHTPKAGSVTDDFEWAEQLLQFHGM
jgi:hypothetical protein